MNTAHEIKKFSEFVKDRKETDKKPNQKPDEDGDKTAVDSIIKTGLDQSAQIAGFNCGDNQ